MTKSQQSTILIWDRVTTVLHSSIGLAAVSIGLGLIAAGTTQAQVGTGWSQTSFVKSIHLDDATGLHSYSWTSYKSVGNPICADYSSSGDTETFRILNGNSNRSEIRLNNDYSSGNKQFQGYVKFNAPLNDECLMQIFGSTSGATQMMMRGYSSNSGEIRCVGTPSGTISTFAYGVEKRINVIHYQGNRIEVYRNGSLQQSGTDNESVTNYWKYGCYGTLTTGPVTVTWRQVRTYAK